MSDLYKSRYVALTEKEVVAVTVHNREIAGRAALELAELMLVVRQARLSSDLVVASKSDCGWTGLLRVKLPDFNLVFSHHLLSGGDWCGPTTEEKVRPEKYPSVAEQLEIDPAKITALKDRLIASAK